MLLVAGGGGGSGGMHDGDGNGGGSVAPGSTVYDDDFDTFLHTDDSLSDSTPSDGGNGAVYVLLLAE